MAKQDHLENSDRGGQGEATKKLTFGCETASIPTLPCNA
jgi:hypothetical protein